MKDFLFTLLAWLFTFPMIIGGIAFAVYNNDPVPVTVNPFQGPVDMPVYIPVLTAIAFGFLFGAVMTWASMGSLRKELRDQKRLTRTLEKQIEETARTSPVIQNYTVIPSTLSDRY